MRKNVINKIEKLMSLGEIAIQANTIDRLIIKCDDDDDDRHSRRSCLRIHGIEWSDDERNDNVLQRVKECYQEMNFLFQDENIDRVHWIGRTYTDKNTGKKSNASSWSILGNLANNFIMQERSILPIVNRNQVNIYLVYWLISQEGHIYY